VNLKGLRNLDDHIDFGKDKDAAQNWGEPYINHLHGTLGKEEKKAIYDYTVFPTNLDNYLYEQCINPNGYNLDINLEQQAARIKFAIKDLILPENLKLYKRLSIQDLGSDIHTIHATDANGEIVYGKLDVLKVNALTYFLERNVFRHYPQFLLASLTADPVEHNDDFQIPIRAEFIVEKGGKGAYIAHDEFDANPSELQMLLPSSIAFQYKGADIINEKGRDILKVVYHQVPDYKYAEEIHLDRTDFTLTELKDDMLISDANINYNENNFFPKSRKLFTGKVFNYKLVTDEANSGIIEAPTPNEDGIVTVNFPWGGVLDSTPFELYAVDPISHKEFLVLNHQPNIIKIGKEIFIRFSYINKNINIMTHMEEQPISNQDYQWHIYDIDSNTGEAIMELYNFSEKMTPKQIKTEVSKLLLKGKNVLITDRAYDVREWLWSSNEYYIDGIVVSKKVHTPVTKYQVILNGNDIGTALPYKVRLDGSHEVLFIPECYDIEQWGIPAHSNEIQVFAIVVDKGYIYEVAHHLPKKQS
jgi:hypothetical protein